MQVNKNKINDLPHEEELYFAIDAAELATFSFNPVTNKFKTNNRLKEWFGLPLNEEVDLESALSRVIESERQKVSDAIQHVQSETSDGKYEIEYSIINPETNIERRLFAKGKVLFKDGKAYKFSGIIQDITRQNKLFNNLQESEKKFRDTVKQAPVGITILKGNNFIPEMANNAYLEIIDKTETEFVGKPLFDSLPEAKDAVLNILTDVLTTGDPYYGKEFPVTLNRYGKMEIAYFNFVYQPLKENDGKISGVIVVANDITNLVVAKHTLTESEVKFKNLVLQSPIPKAILRGKDFVIELANHSMFKKLWKKNPQDVIGKKLLDVFPELHQQKFPGLLNQVYETGKSYRENESLAYVQGDDDLKRFYLDFEYAPLFDIDNNVSGIFITMNDVTEKVETRKRIEDAEERARLAISAGELGAYEIDFKTNTIQSDERFKEIFNTDENASWNEIVNKIDENDADIRSHAHEHAMQTGILTYEARFKISDHHKRWILIKGRILFDKDKTPLRLLGIVQDVTHQKEISEALEKMVTERTKELADINEQLQQSNTELNQFAYIASHDLQEPLRKVRTFTDLMSASLNSIPEKAKLYIDKIHSSTARMQNLINDVLQFSLLSKEREKFGLVNLNNILNTVLNDYELSIEQKGAKITIDTLPVIEAIPLQMSQLFTNLISNALKFNKTNNTLVISVTSESLNKKDFELLKADSKLTYCKIQFADNGIGFEQKNAEQIFTIFQRLHGRTEFEGTGIGLAMCKKIVQNHHGIIYADAEVEKGAVFTILLPEFQYKLAT